MEPQPIQYSLALEYNENGTIESLILHHPTFFVALAGCEGSQSERRKDCFLINASGLKTVRQALNQNGYHWAYVYPLSMNDIHKVSEKTFDKTICTHSDYPDGKSMGFIHFNRLPKVLEKHLLSLSIKAPDIRKNNSDCYKVIKLDSCCI